MSSSCVQYNKIFYGEAFQCSSQLKAFVGKSCCNEIFIKKEFREKSQSIKIWVNGPEYSVQNKFPMLINCVCKLNAVRFFLEFYYQFENNQLFILKVNF